MLAPHRSVLAVSILLSLACASRTVVPEPDGTAAAPVIATGRELVDAMHARYAGRYLSTLSFVQNNTLYPAAGGEQKTQWLEHIAVPGRLRIDYVPLANHSGVLYEGGRVHVFDNGRQMQSQPSVNPLLLLGMDVYAQPPEITARMLDSLGFALEGLREAEWQGRRTYIVGAAEGDTVTSQFWVDAERLLFVRMFHRTPGAAAVTEYRFDRYTDFDGVPIAIEVLMLRNGRPVFREEYANVRVNVPIPDALFDPSKWVEAQPTLPPAGPSDGAKIDAAAGAGAVRR